MIFFGRFSKNPQILNFMEIRPVGAKLIHEHRKTDGMMEKQTAQT